MTSGFEEHKGALGRALWNPIAARSPLALLVVGYSLVLGFFSIDTFSYTLLSPARIGAYTHYDLFLFWSTLFMIPTALAGAIRSKVIERAARSPLMPFTAAALLVLCLVLSVATDPFGMQLWSVIISGLAFGIGATLFRFSFVCLCLDMDDRNALLALVLANVIGAFIYYTAIALPYSTRIVLLAVLPIAAAICLNASRGRSYEAPPPPVLTEEDARRVRRIMIILALLIPLVFMASTIARLSLYSSSESAGSGGVWQMTMFWMMLASLFVAALVLSHLRKRIVLGSFFVVLLVVLLFFFIAPFTKAPIAEASVICGVLGNILELFFMALCIRCIRITGMPAPHVFALIVGSLYVGRFVGHAFPMYCGSLDLSAYYLPILAMDILIIVLIVALFGSQDALLVLLSGEEQPQSDNTKVTVGPDDQTAIAEQYGLTLRQAEVLNYLLNGYTTRMISKRLNLSEGTVKAHIHQIYTLIGVGSREELLEKFLS